MVILWLGWMTIQFSVIQKLNTAVLYLKKKKTLKYFFTHSSQKENDLFLMSIVSGFHWEFCILHYIVTLLHCYQYEQTPSAQRRKGDNHIFVITTINRQPQPMGVCPSSVLYNNEQSHNPDSLKCLIKFRPYSLIEWSGKQGCR